MKMQPAEIHGERDEGVNPGAGRQRVEHRSHGYTLQSALYAETTAAEFLGCAYPRA